MRRVVRSWLPALAREFRLAPADFDAMSPREAAGFMAAIAASFEPDSERSEAVVRAAREAAAARARATARWLLGHGPGAR